MNWLIYVLWSDWEVNVLSEPDICKKRESWCECVYGEWYWTNKRQKDEWRIGNCWRIWSKGDSLLGIPDVCRDTKSIVRHSVQEKMKAGEEDRKY